MNQKLLPVQIGKEMRNENTLVGIITDYKLAQRYEFYALVRGKNNISLPGNLTRDILFLPLEQKIDIFSPSGVDCKKVTLFTTKL